MSGIKDEIDGDIPDNIGGIHDSLTSGSAQPMNAQEVENINQVVDELMRLLIADIDQRLGAKGVDVGMFEKVKIKGVRLALNTVQKYSAQFNAEAKMDRFVAATNDALPTLTKIFGEQTILAKIPPEYRTEEIAVLSDKAGATELAALLRRGMQPGA